MRPNRPRRRLIVAVTIPAFLLVYVISLVTISAHLPKIPWVVAIYFAIGGLAWGVPLLPLISWSEGLKFFKPKPKNPDQIH